MTGPSATQAGVSEAGVSEAGATEPAPREAATTEGGPRSVDTVVVGAGVAGLTAAHDLAANGHDVVVLEAAERVGGKLWARELAGAPIDVGADAMLARHGAGVDLAQRLGLELAHPATGSVQLVADGVLRRLPTGTMLGVPTDLVALARSRVLSPAGLARAGLEGIWPRRRRPAGDRCVADVVAERYGREVVDRLVEPMLGGVYAGRPDRLSVEATAPMVAEADRHGRSLAHGLQHLMAERTVSGPVFATPTTTMASLAAALVDRVEADAGGASGAMAVRTGVAVTGVARSEAGTGGGDWVVATEDGTWLARTVVVAVPAHAATGLLADVAAGTAVELAGIRHASVGVVSLHFGDASLEDLPDASGVLVPRREGRLVKAGTWLARKWPHLADRGAVLRVSVGRIDDVRWQELDDDELVTAVVDDVRDLTGLGVAPTDVLVTRWHDGLPQYEVGHLERVDRARHHLPPGILLAGAAYDGIGVSPCVASGHQAAWGAMQELAAA